MSQVISRSNSEFLYQQVIQLVRDLCLQGSLLPGEKLPSFRKMADKLNISIPTVKQAYQLLEGQGLIEAREKSGILFKVFTVKSVTTKAS